MNNLSPIERQILDLLRDLKPFERLEIVVSSSGIIKSILVKREQKIVIKHTGELTRIE